MVLLLVLEWTYQEATFLLLQSYSYKLSCVIHLGQGVIKLSVKGQKGHKAYTSGLAGGVW